MFEFRRMALQEMDVLLFCFVTVLTNFLLLTYFLLTSCTYEAHWTDSGLNLSELTSQIKNKYHTAVIKHVHTTLIDYL